MGCQPAQVLSDASAAALFDDIRAFDLRTVDEVVALLPPQYRAHYVLAYAGHAAQTSSELNPRVLAFGRDAHLIITFNGEADQPGFEMLEVAELNASTAQFEYSFITLDGHAEASRSEVNPARCLACHGEKPRTLFNDYPVWPGFYGSNGDGLIPGSDEQLAFSRYLDRAAFHPRYSKLSREFISKDARGEPAVGVLHHPNNVYGKLLARRQATRLAQDLLSQADVRPKLLSYLAWNFHVQQGQCAHWSTALETAVFEPMARFARERTAARYPKRSFWWAAQSAAEVEQPLERFVLSLGSREVFTERMAPVQQVSAEVGPDARIGYNDGLDEISALVASALVERLPEAQAFFVKVSSAQLASEKGFADRYADGSSEIFDSVLPRWRLNRGGCDALESAAAAEW